MCGQIEKIVRDTVIGYEQRNILDFISFLRANEMSFERGTGYWERQFYWMIKYRNQFVCFILINGTGPEKKFSPFTIWSDDSGSNWFEKIPLDEHMKEIAWKNVDFCEKCGACSGGICKTIFGKKFYNVCRTTMRFVNPDDETLRFVKKMVEIRRDDILKQCEADKMNL